MMKLVMVGAAYNEIGVAAVAMGGGDILEALQKARSTQLSGAARSLTQSLVSKSG